VKLEKKPGASLSKIQIGDDGTYFQINPVGPSSQVKPFKPTPQQRPPLDMFSNGTLFTSPGWWEAEAGESQDHVK